MTFMVPCLLVSLHLRNDVSARLHSNLQQQHCHGNLAKGSDVCADMWKYSFQPYEMDFILYIYLIADSCLESKALNQD